MALPPWLRYQIKLYIFIAHCCIVFLLSAHSRSWQQSHGTTSATTTTTILVSTRTSRHLCGRRKLAAKVIHKLLSTQVHMCVCICVLVRCSSAEGRYQDATMPGCSKTLLFVYAPLFILYFLLLLHCCHFHCMLYICMCICVYVYVCVLFEGGKSSKGFRSCHLLQLLWLLLFRKQVCIFAKVCTAFDIVVITKIHTCIHIHIH